MSRVKVLIVDDSPETALILSRFLELHGFPVAIANSAATALEMMNQDLYKIVFTDIQMPGMNGLDLMKAIKARYPIAIVVIMTAYHDVPMVVECVENGAHDFIVKPIVPLDIVLEVANDAEKKLNRWAQAIRPGNYPQQSAQA